MNEEGGFLPTTPATRMEIDNQGEVTFHSPDGTRMNLEFAGVSELDAWIDQFTDPLYKTQPLALDWARISKVAEEVGEAIQAFIGATGQNPRKGCEIGVGLTQVKNELADALFACLLAIQHFTKDENATRFILESRWAYRIEKAHLPTS